MQTINSILIILEFRLLFSILFRYILISLQFYVNYNDFFYYSAVSKRKIDKLPLSGPWQYLTRAQRFRYRHCIDHLGKNIEITKKYIVIYGPTRRRKTTIKRYDSDCHADDEAENEAEEARPDEPMEVDSSTEDASEPKECVLEVRQESENARDVDMEVINVPGRSNSASDSVHVYEESESESLHSASGVDRTCPFPNWEPTNYYSDISEWEYDGDIYEAYAIEDQIDPEIAVSDFEGAIFESDNAADPEQDVEELELRCNGLEIGNNQFEGDCLKNNTVKSDENLGYVNEGFGKVAEF